MFHLRMRITVTNQDWLVIPSHALIARHGGFPIFVLVDKVVLTAQPHTEALDAAWAVETVLPVIY